MPNWTRGQLKNNAKMNFYKNYWMCVGMALILTLVLMMEPDGPKKEIMLKIRDYTDILSHRPDGYVRRIPQGIKTAAPGLDFQYNWRKYAPRYGAPLPTEDFLRRQSLLPPPHRQGEPPQVPDRKLPRLHRYRPMSRLPLLKLPLSPD